MRALVPVLALAILVGLAVDARAQVDDACDQEPGQRFFWIERAFCDLEHHGPEAAQGVIIWNHGISGSLPQFREGVPPAFRLAQARGWDVLALKRHHLAEDGGSIHRAVERTLVEVRARRERGYRKVVLAGQSFGGHVSLEAADASGDVFAVAAFAPGWRASGASGRLDPTITDRQLQTVRARRIALVLPRDDSVFGGMARGETAARILAGRRVPFLLVDEASGLTGHAGGLGGRFALRYGLCLVDFLSSPGVPPGRFACPAAADDWPVARELTMPAPSPAWLPPGADAGLASLVGPWYGLVDDAVVLFGLVERPGGGWGAVVRWASAGSGGGEYDARLEQGRVHLTLRNRWRIAVGRDGAGVVLALTSPDGARVTRAPLARAPGR
jgi:dienelactone hydrolase